MERNTQFSKFADGVVQELMSVHDGAMQASEWWQEQARTIIAQRSYDLAQSFFEHHYGDEAPFKQEEIQRSIHMLPDLTELPEVSE